MKPKTIMIIAFGSLLTYAVIIKTPALREIVFKGRTF